MDKKLFSLICAITCSLIWGSAFIAQDMGMDYNGPLTFTAGRLFLGFLTLLPFLIIFEKRKIADSNLTLKDISLNLFFIGFLLAAGNALQQYALLYTDVANTAVFTIFYVLIVPFVSYLFFSKNIHWSVWPCVIICFIGGFLLTDLNNVTVRIGDSIAVFNAFFWAFHIVFISRFLRKFNHPITIAALQSLFASLFAIIPALAFEELILSNILQESYEILYVGLLSSSLAFLLQAYSLQNLSATAAAIIFSLEGVFAAILGWIILDQYLNEIKIFGIFLIVSAVIFSQIIPNYGKKKYE